MSDEGLGGFSDDVPPPDTILQFFEYGHLPGPLAQVSQSFAMLAHNIASTLPPNEMRGVALRKLLEAKDAAVRAVIQR